MDLGILMELITTLGFPIACVIAMGFFIWKIYKQSVEREARLMLEIQENRKVNEKAIETISLYAERMGHIESNLEEIKTDIVDIKQKIQ